MTQQTKSFVAEDDIWSDRLSGDRAPLLFSDTEDLTDITSILDSHEPHCARAGGSRQDSSRRSSSVLWMGLCLVSLVVTTLLFVWKSTGKFETLLGWRQYENNATQGWRQFENNATHGNVTTHI